MNEYIVKQVDCHHKKPNIIHSLFMPSFNEPEFYRQTVSLNSFFTGTKKRNWAPDGRLYILSTMIEYEIDKDIAKSTLLKLGVDISIKHSGIVFNGIWDFYSKVGYDRKNKKWIQSE